MPSTFTYIAKVTPSTDSFSFTSIPQTYQDLVIIGIAKSQTSAVYEDLAITFNNVSVDYKAQSIIGTNTTFSNFSNGTGMSNYFEMQRGIVGSNANMSGSFSPVWIYIPMYKSSSLNRTILWRSGYSNTAAGGAGTFNGGVTIGGGIAYTVGTSAITSIKINTVSVNNFQGGSSGTQFILYGIKSA